MPFLWLGETAFFIWEGLWIRLQILIPRSDPHPRHSRERGEPNDVGFGCSAPLRVFGCFLFRPSGESLLSVATKGTKKACPDIRARWSRATLTNSPATEARPDSTSLY